MGSVEGDEVGIFIGAEVISMEGSDVGKIDVVIVGKVEVVNDGLKLRFCVIFEVGYNVG